MESQTIDKPRMLYTDLALRRTVVPSNPPDYKRGEKRLIFATPTEPCTT